MQIHANEDLEAGGPSPSIIGPLGGCFVLFFWGTCLVSQNCIDRGPEISFNR